MTLRRCKPSRVSLHLSGVVYHHIHVSLVRALLSSILRFARKDEVTNPTHNSGDCQVHVILVNLTYCSVSISAGPHNDQTDLHMTLAIPKVSSPSRCKVGKCRSRNSSKLHRVRREHMGEALHEKVVFETRN